MRSFKARSATVGGVLVWMVGAGVVGTASSAWGQCAVLLRDDFNLFPRPKGANGRVRDVFVHTNMADFWAPEPMPGPGARWITGDGGNVPNWQFAASSIDPIEPPEDPEGIYNGTAFTDSLCAAVAPVTQLPMPMTMSADVVLPLGLTGSVLLGFTSSTATTGNFVAGGKLWAQVDGLGRFWIRSGAGGVIASGEGTWGVLNSGWMGVELTIDPTTHQAWGRVGETAFGPVPAPFAGTMTHAGMEKTDPAWAVVNNLVVRVGTGTSMTLQPAPATVCPGQTATFQAGSDSSRPTAFAWRRDGWMLQDGPQSDGSIVAGARTGTLTISQVSASSAGVIDCVIGAACGNVVSLPAKLDVNCCRLDYNLDTALNLDDLGDFITDFYTQPPIPGGVQPAAPSLSDRPAGFGSPSPNAPDAPAPYAPDAYRLLGYRVGFSLDGSNTGPVSPDAPFPNLDNLGDYVTAFYAGGSC
jgi:hypothetical protein